jgi:hypothetical protein
MKIIKKPSQEVLIALSKMVLGFVSLFRMLFMITYFSNSLIMGLAKKTCHSKYGNARESNKSLLRDRMVNHIIRAPLATMREYFKSLQVTLNARSSHAWCTSCPLHAKGAYLKSEGKFQCIC